ncbi:hypothetical protein CRM22_002493 [Opisthorchis felineus]|uniref:LsmAD domain-containing protein n=1 Tax=Opisthorchis felineus TaxID=147828 RepID=A0A4S2MC55_OPIFE|nr:hypothetical protein CRM22_002493 [Opisthorchis felineus]
MSVHNQRGKVKSASRVRPQRMPANSFNYSKAPPAFNSSGTNDDGLGIFSSTELTYWLGRHALGNIGEVTTVDSEKILGLIRAISPGGDMGLTYAYTTHKTKNGHVHASDITVPLSDWKMVRIPNIKLSDGLMGELKNDTEPSLEPDSTEIGTNGKELVPFFASSDAVQDCVLDQGGFPAEEMFKTNKELFSVSSTYNPELTEYTTAVDRSAPNFSETEARCAQLARDIEGSQPSSITPEDGCEDEELAFSAVVRTPRDLPVQPRPSVRKTRGSQERISTVRAEPGKARTQPIQTAAANTSDSAEPPAKSSESMGTESTKPDAQLVSAAPKTSNLALPEKPALADDSRSSTSTQAPPEDIVVNSTARITSSVEEKVKKSTLDPNAPEFHPLSLQYANLAQQPQMHSVLPASSFASPVVHQAVPNSQSGQVAMPTLQTFVATAQPHLYAPSSVPYGPHSGPIPHLLSAANNVQPHVRGGSLPPTIHQQHFPTSINPQASLLLQQSQQPGMSLPQLITSQPPVIAGPAPANRFSGPPSSVAHVHQRSDTSTTPHSSAYGIPQANMSVSTFQPPLYQIPQSGGPIPLWVTGHPQMGLHFISGAGGSSQLMVGNIPLSQASGQQLYPAHAMLHMQPTQLSVQVQVPQAPPSTTPQPSQSQQVFQAHSAPFQEHPHHIQLPAYAANMLSSQQASAQNYYPAPPTVLAGPNPNNAAVQPGLLPLMNHSAQHPASGNVGHHPPTMDPSILNQLPNPQFTQQPNDILQQFAAAHFFQAQLAAGQHLNSQSFPRTYQTLAAMVANNNNPSSQSH